MFIFYYFKVFKHLFEVARGLTKKIAYNVSIFYTFYTFNMYAVEVY
jgi:hypothetical protein